MGTVGGLSQHGTCLPCRFWHQRDRLIEAGLLQEQHVVVPCAAQLRVAAASMPDLWHSRAAVGTVEGVDLSCCNEQLGEQASPCSLPRLHQRDQHRALPVLFWAHVWLVPACQAACCMTCDPIGHEAACPAMPYFCGQRPGVSRWTSGETHRPGVLPQAWALGSLARLLSWHWLPLQVLLAGVCRRGWTLAGHPC